MSGNIAVRLLDGDGMAVSTANVSADFWWSWSTQCAAGAQHAGFTVQADDKPPPTFGSEMNVACLADWRAFLAMQDNAADVKGQLV